MLKRALILLSSLTAAAADSPPSLDALRTELQKKLEAVKTTSSKIATLTERLNDVADVYDDVASINEGRLTLLTNVPVTTTDQSNASTIYFTPFNGSCISLYNGTTWKLYRFTQRTLALAGLTTDKNYDVFIYDNAGTLTLETSAAWAGDNSRTDNIVLQDGVYVKSGATTRRYLGTFRATSATQTQDKISQRFLWNYQNRLRRYLLVNDAANSWAYATDSWRAADNSNVNRVELVLGLAGTLVTARALSLGQSNTAGFNYFASGIGINSVTTDSSSLRGGGSYIGANTGVISQAWSHYHGYPTLGYHYIQWLERANTTGVTFYGDNNAPTMYQSGMYVETEG